MQHKQKILLFTLRVSLGWIFLYSSLSKLIVGNWSSAGFLSQAQSLQPLFTWFSSPQNIGWVDFFNVYGQLALGIALVLGIFLPLAALGGTLMMLLYYLAQLHFPFIGKGTLSLLIDDHIVYSLCLLLLWHYDAGLYWGLKKQGEKLLPKSLRKLL